MAISGILDIARRALLAQQAALRVIGNNVANVNTPGYSREEPLLEAARARFEGGARVGGGVRFDGVQQIVDSAIERRLLAARSGAGEKSATRDELRRLEEAFTDLQDQGGLPAALDAFFAAADALARNPEGLPERRVLLARGGALAAEVRRRAASLAELQRGVDDRLVDTVGRANELIARVAELNGQIVPAELGGQVAAALRDQRRVAIGELARILGLHVLERDDGSVRVASTSGIVLVDGSTAHALAVHKESAGLDGLPLHEVGTTGADGGFISLSSRLGGGELEGLLDVRDNKLPALASDLDTFATTLRDAVNAVQTDAAGRDLDGNVGTDFFSGSGAADLTVALSDPRAIAAARSAEPGDNQGALALAGLASTTFTALGGATLGGALATELARVGEQVRSAEDSASVAAALLTQAENARDAVSGVNLNEELTTLLGYQRAFQAAGVLTRVGNSVLDDLLRMV